MGTRDELAALVDDARRHRRPAADRPRRCRWTEARDGFAAMAEGEQSSARSCSPADGRPTWSPAPAPASARGRSPSACSSAGDAAGAAGPVGGAGRTTCARSTPAPTVAGRRPGRRREVESLARPLPGRARLAGPRRRRRRARPGRRADAAVWQEQLAVNLVAPARADPGRAARAARRARHRRLGQLRRRPAAHPQWSAYAASKHGLRALADSLRAEEAEHGVRVTSVYPGRTATPMQAARCTRRRARRTTPRDWIDPATVADAILAGARPAGGRDRHRPDDRRLAGAGSGRPAPARRPGPAPPRSAAGTWRSRRRLRRDRPMTSARARRRSPAGRRRRRSRPLVASRWRAGRPRG